MPIYCLENEMLYFHILHYMRMASFWRPTTICMAGLIQPKLIQSFRPRNWSSASDRWSRGLAVYVSLLHTRQCTLHTANWKLHTAHCKLHTALWNPSIMKVNYSFKLHSIVIIKKSAVPYISATSCKIIGNQACPENMCSAHSTKQNKGS